MPGAANGIALSVDVLRFLCQKPAITQLLKEYEQPALPRDCSASIGLWKDVCRTLEGAPRTLTTVPGPVDCLIELFVFGEMVGFRRETIKMTVPFCNALKDLYRQQGSFCLDGGEGFSMVSPHSLSR